MLNGLAAPVTPHGNEQSGLSTHRENAPAFSHVQAFRLDMSERDPFQL